MRARSGGAAHGSAARDARKAKALAIAAAIAACVYDPRATAAEPKRVAARLVGIAALAIATVYPPPARAARAIPRVWFAAAGFLGIAGLSAAYGIPSGLLDLALWFGAVGIAMGAARLGRRSAVLAARWAGLLAGTVAAALAIAAFAREGRGFALHGGQGNPNWLGLLLAVALPLAIDALASIVRAKERIAAVFAFIAVAAQIIALWLAHSRVAWCAAAIAIGAWALASFRHRGAIFACARGYVAIGVAAVVLVAGSLIFARGHRISGDVSAEASVRGRAVILGHALVAAERAVPFGVGLGRFAHAFLDAQGEALSELDPKEAATRFVNATTAHDEVVQIAIESGPIAAVFFVACVLLGAHAHWRGRFRAGAASLVAFGMSSLGDSPLRQPAVVILVALVLAAVPRRRAPAVSRRDWLRAGVAGVAIASAFLLALVTRGWIATRVRVAADEREPLERRAALARAVAIDAGSGEALLDLGLIELALGDAEHAIARLEASKALLANVGTDAAIGEAALALGDNARAARAFRAALAHHAGSLPLLAEGSLDDAARAAAVASRLAPGDLRVRALVDRIREAEMIKATGAP
jgi:hypothetical protein